MRNDTSRFTIPASAHSPDRRAHGLAPAEITALVYELLDAHADTIDLAAEIASEDRLHWRAHLEYLRDLQRVSRERLARGATLA